MLKNPKDNGARSSLRRSPPPPGYLYASSASDDESVSSISIQMLPSKLRELAVLTRLFCGSPPCRFTLTHTTERGATSRCAFSTTSGSAMKGRPTLSKPGTGGGGADFAALGGRGTTAGPTNTQNECRTALHIRGTDPPCPPVVAGRYSEIPTAPPCSTARTLGSQQRLPFVTTLRLWLTIFPRRQRRLRQRRQLLCHRRR